MGVGGIHSLCCSNVVTSRSFSCWRFCFVRRGRDIGRLRAVLADREVIPVGFMRILAGRVGVGLLVFVTGEWHMDKDAHDQELDIDGGLFASICRSTLLEEIQGFQSCDSITSFVLQV